MSEFKIDPDGVPVALRTKIIWMQLAQLRKQKRINQSSLAQALNLKQTTISHFENGRTRPSLMTQFALAKFFEFDGIEELNAALEKLIHWPDYRDTIKEYLLLDEQKVPARARRYSLKTSTGNFEVGSPRISVGVPKYYQQKNVEINSANLSGTLISGDSKESIEMPPILAGKEHTYSVVINDNCMAPRYEKGDTVLIDPNLAPTSGDDVAIKLYYAGYQVVIIRRLTKVEIDWDELRPFMNAVFEATKAHDKKELKDKEVNAVFESYRKDGTPLDEARRYFFDSLTGPSQDRSIVITESIYDGSFKVAGQKLKTYLAPGATIPQYDGTDIQMVTFGVLVGCHYRVKSESERMAPYRDPDS